MIAIEQKSNGKRLFAAIIAFAMVVCAVAVVAIPGGDAVDANTASQISVADSYEYDDYDYAGDRTIVGNDIMMSYDVIDINKTDGENVTPDSARNIMNDFARFVGALYWANSESVESIVYNDTSYTWNSELDLSGSNWESADKNTLVKDVTDDVTALTTWISGGKLNFTLNLADGSQVAFTYGLETFAANIGTVYYGTLAAAVDASSTGETITLLKDSYGEGIFVGASEKKTITIDFDGYTYTIGGPAVGSPGYESQAFHLEMNNTITLKDGTITSTSDSGVKMLVQNYSDLTLENMVLDATNVGTGNYAFSNNNGNITITGKTVITAPANGFAFDVYGGFQSYENVTVTIDSGFTGKINGIVDLSRQASTTNNNVNTLAIEADVSIDTLQAVDGALTVSKESQLTVGSMSIGASATITNSGTIALETAGSTISMANGSTLSGVISADGASVELTGLKAGDGGLTITAGSIEISGTIDASSKVEIDGTSGTITIDGEVYSGETSGTGGLTITGTDGEIIIGDITLGNNASLEIKGGENVVVDGTVNATAEGAKVTLNDAVGGNGTINGAVTAGESGFSISGNMAFDSLSGKITINEGATLIVGTLTNVESIENSGVIVVTGSIKYTGESNIIIQTGISSTPEIGSLYYTGAVSGITGQNFSVIAAANPIDSNAEITNAPTQEYLNANASEDVVIVALTANMEGLTVTGNVTIAGTATGAMYLDGGNLTIGTAGDDFSVNGVSFSGMTDLALSGDKNTITVSSDITDDGSTIGLSETGADVVIDAGYKINGDVTDGTNTVTFASVTAGTGGMHFTYGSVEINGDFILNGTSGTESTISSEEQLIITGNTSITGNGTISVHELVIAQGATLTIGQNVVIKINGTTDDTLVVNTGATITGDGYIQLTGASSGITNNGTIDVEVRVDPEASTIEVGSPEEFVNALPYYTNIKVTDVLGFVSDSKEYPASISVENKVITISDDAGFNIGEGVTISFIGTTINVASDADAYTFTVDPKAFLVIDDSDIYANVNVEEQSLTLRNNVTNIDGSSIYLTSVGFGKIINFNNNYNLGSGSELTVYGTLNVASGYTLTVGNATVDVQSSGVINVAGTLNMAGTMKVYGTVEVTGEMNMTGTLTVDVDGEVDVSGTTTVSGTLSGVIDNHGTITFAGTVDDDAGIDMYPGSSLSVTSMAGTSGLTVTGATSYVKPADADTNKDYIPPVENTSSITLTGISGVVITADETVTTQPYAQDEKKTQEVYTVTLDISGSAVTSTNGEIETDITNGGKVTIEQTLDLAKGVNMVFGDGTADVDYVINGTLNAADGATITNNGTITVVGEITTVGATAVAVSNVNGVYYDVTTAASGTSSAYVTRTYTSLATAVDVTNADNGTIYAVGAITVDADSSITVPATLKLSSTAAITVKGTLVFSDYETSYLTKTNEIKSGVLIDEAPARTYTSLANAIGMGVTEITLNGDVVIKSDLTIPAGVTVSSDKYGVSVGTGKSNANVTLTVEGALELTGTSIAEDNHDGIRLVTGQTVGTTTYQGRLVLGGTGYVYTVNSAELEDLVAGAYYKKLPSETASTPVNVIATIDRAAADSENVYADSGAAAIDIHGAVSTTSDLTFTAAEDVQLKVTVQADSTDEDDIHASSLTAPSVTIVGDVSIMTNDADTDGKSATISTTIVFGDSSVILAGINSVSITTTEIEEVTYLSMNVAATSGTATVQSGNVIVSGSVSGTTAGGATIAVANGASMTVSDSVTIDGYGSLNVEGTMAVAVDGKVTIDENGTANVTGQVTVTGDMDVIGTLNVDGGTVQTATPENSDTPGTIDITGTAVVGTKPTSIGFTSTGTLTGAQVTGSGIVKAYNGASVTMLANTDGTSTAVSTVLNIRAAGGEYFAYMTVYAQTGNSTVKVFENVINKEIFALEGYDTGLFYENGSVDNSGLFKYGNWYTSSDRVANTALTDDVNVGAQNYTALYAQVELVSVSITVSEGTGLNLYIDDIAVNSGSVSLPIGTHTVRFDVQAQYDGSNATITFNGQTVANGGTIEVTTGSAGYVLACSGAVPAQSGSGDITVNVPSQDDGMSLTDILLIVLVILIVIMAIIVALRLMRS